MPEIEKQNGWEKQNNSVKNKKSRAINEIRNLFIQSVGLIILGALMWCLIFSNASDATKNAWSEVVVGLIVGRVLMFVVDIIDRKKNSDSDTPPRKGSVTRRGLPATNAGLPRLALLFIDILLNKKEKEDAFGHIEDEFEYRRKKHGLRAAQTWVWTQVIRSMGPFVLRLLAFWKIFQFIK